MKKQYICPSVCVIEIDAMTLLAGSGGTDHTTEQGPGTGGDDGGAEDGGSCSKEYEGSLWDDSDW